MIELCEVCYDFMKTIGNKDIIKITLVEQKQCKGIYHKKLVDSFKT